MSPGGPGRGHFEVMELQGDSWRISGWICHPDFAAASIAVLVDGIPMAESSPTQRDDVASILSWIPHAGASGFHFDLPREPGRQRVAVQARQGDRVLTTIRTTLAPEFEALEHPTPEMM